MEEENFGIWRESLPFLSIKIQFKLEKIGNFWEINIFFGPVIFIIYKNNKRKLDFVLLIVLVFKLSQHV